MLQWSVSRSCTIQSPTSEISVQRNIRTTTANDLQLRFQALKEMRSHIKWLDALKLNLGIARDDVPAETVQTPIMPNLLAWLTINRGVEAALSAGEAMFDFTEDVPFESLEGLKPKSRLQEVVQAAYGTRPVYKVIEKSGPEYSLIFKVEVSIPSKAATGIGRSIKEAEATAAQNLLNVFDARETRRTPRRLSYLTERHLSDQEKVKLERFWNEVLVLTAKRSCRLSHAVALVGTPLRLRGFVQQNQRNQFSILGSAIIQLYAGLTAVENNAGRKFAVALCNRGNLERAFDQANLLEYACLGRIGDQTDHKYRVETMEAIMGYLFLYVGESASKRFFERIRAACSAVEVSNPKGKLLELIQAAIHAQPEIEYVVKKTGTNLGDNWKVVLRFRGHLFGTGEHRNKGEAEKQAAQQTLNDPRFQAMLEELRPSEGFGTADAPTAQS